MIWLILKHCWSHLWCHEQYSEGIESINPPSGTNESILFFRIQGPKYRKAQQLSVFPSTHYASPHGRRDFQALLDCVQQNWLSDGKASNKSIIASQVTLLIPENPTFWDKLYLWTATAFERWKTVCSTISYGSQLIPHTSSNCWWFIWFLKVWCMSKLLLKMDCSVPKDDALLVASHDFQQPHPEWVASALDMRPQSFFPERVFGNAFSWHFPWKGHVLMRIDDGWVCSTRCFYSDTPLAIAVGVDTMLYSHIPNVTKTVLSCVFPFKQFAD